MRNTVNDKLLSIERSLGRLEGKVDGINTRLDRINGSISNHDKRINELEDSVSNMEGKAGIIGALVAFIVSLAAIVIKFFKG